ncbi:MAG: hypothetical protein JXK07_01360 [Spirochaetes bacterium]|nr:hypothetical protein [Spirochaetota bacterium]
MSRFPAPEYDNIPEYIEKQLHKDRFTGRVPLFHGLWPLIVTFRQLLILSIRCGLF